MAKKLIFTFLWMVVGLAVAAPLAALTGPLLPKVPGGIHGDTARSTTMVYAGYALLPLAVLAVLLCLGLLGKLPGTKQSARK
jgi:hypothetical protein